MRGGSYSIKCVHVGRKTLSAEPFYVSERPVASANLPRNFSLLRSIFYSWNTLSDITDLETYENKERRTLNLRGACKRGL